MCAIYCADYIGRAIHNMIFRYCSALFLTGDHTKVVEVVFSFPSDSPSPSYFLFLWSCKCYDLIGDPHLSIYHGLVHCYDIPSRCTTQ